jgi:uncharacterized protein DUF4035
MLRGITYRHFLEWHAYSELEPFDAERDDIRIASIVQALMNIFRDRKRRSSPFTLDDAVLKFGDAPRRERKQSWQSMKMMGILMAAAFNNAEKKKLAKQQKAA